MRGRLLLAGIALALLVAAYLVLFRGKTVTARLEEGRPVATIGSGADALPVAGNGAVLAWLPAPEEGTLPRLPLTVPPKLGRLRGPALEQVRVLAACPSRLRPYVEGSRYGESGVDVLLDSGIELRFGTAGQAARKWRSAAAVLADPTVTALDYVDVQAPAHPATGGSGHVLPSPP